MKTDELFFNGQKNICFFKQYYRLSKNEKYLHQMSIVSKTKVSIAGTIKFLGLALLIYWLIVTPGWAEIKSIFTTDFETEMFAAGWTNVGAGEYGKNLIWSDTGSYSGKHHLSIVKHQDIAVDGGWESPPFLVKPNQYYKVSFFAKSPQPNYWTILFYNQYGALIGGDHSSLINAAQEWTKQEFYFQTKFPGVTGSIVFKPLTEQSLPLDIDNLSITPVTREDVGKWVELVYGKVRTIDYKPLEAREKQLLPNTIKKLKYGGNLNIVLLGDSIANDLSNSFLDILLERRFPKTHINMQFTGKGGISWLKLQSQVQQRIINHQPDLVICMAISNNPKYLSSPLLRIIDITKKFSQKTDFLLLSPHLRSWYEKKNDGLVHRNALLQVANNRQVAIIDLMTAWENYLIQNNKQVDSLLRDSVHMNELGRQLSAQIIVDYLSRIMQGV
ncbi:hypothetical protein LC608_22940 [Nostoc sp. XA010]|uniref:SGNH/GDSL hydrolase family protein n=1 Tax=Nostoc sp. XA010 TaxID=2780407 RepID=UPI001E458E6F|nr:hypothetical protein [Nostoc sp. XA010]MCC5659777.1 hypothetical protein [Nostoc sp. XA010]